MKRNFIINRFKRYVLFIYKRYINKIVTSQFLIFFICMIGLVVYIYYLGHKNTNVNIDEENSIFVDNSFKDTITSLEVPKVPQLIRIYMNGQLPKDLGRFASDFDWFDFYDPVFKTKVEVKYSGLNWAHHESLLNKTITYKFNNNEYRLKSLASEVTSLAGGGKNFDNPISLIFSEYAAYNIANEITDNTPISELVYLNDDPTDLFIRWKDDFSNVVRENDNVSWKNIAKVYLYANDKQERYFDIPWKVRNDKSDGTIKYEFIKLLDPVLSLVTREV